MTCLRKLNPQFFFIINPTSIKLFGHSNMRQNCFTHMPISVYSFHYCAKSRTRDLFLNKCGRISNSESAAIKGQFNSKPTALATLPQTCNEIFLCWQITHKSDNLDIFLKNYYIIKAHATLLQRDFYVT